MLTIVIPVADGSDISRLNSWLNAGKFLDFQLVVVHDGTDKNLYRSLVNLTKLIQPSRVKLLNSSCRNPGGARNLGMTVAIGDWIQFCDADDHLNISTTLGVLKTVPENISLVVGQFRKLDSKSNQVINLSDTANLSDVLSEIGLWRCIFRREEISGCLFPQSKMGEDQIFFLSTFPTRKHILYTPEILYDYFVREPNQLTSNKKNIVDLYESISMGLQVQCQNSMEIRLKFQILFKLSMTLLLRGPIGRKKKYLFLLRKVWISAYALPLPNKLDVAIRGIFLKPQKSNNHVCD